MGCQHRTCSIDESIYEVLQTEEKDRRDVHTGMCGDQNLGRQECRQVP